MKLQLVAIVALAAFWIGMWTAWVFSHSEQKISCDLDGQATITLILTVIIHVLGAGVLIQIFLVGLKNTLAP